MVTQPTLMRTRMSSAAPGHVPKRGRPSATQVQAIDRAIVAAARKLFFAEGYDAVAMEQVAALARVSKGTLYARHASKVVLFTAVISAMVADWSQRGAELDHLLTPDIEQRLRHHARTIARFLFEPDVQAAQRLILDSRRRFPELARAMHEHGYRYITRVIAKDLIDDAQCSDTALRDPDSVARMLVSGLAGYEIQNDTNQGELLTFADRLVDVLMAGRSAW